MNGYNVDPNKPTYYEKNPEEFKESVLEYFVKNGIRLNEDQIDALNEKVNNASVQAGIDRANAMMKAKRSSGSSFKSATSTPKHFINASAYKSAKSASSPSSATNHTSNQVIGRFVHSDGTNHTNGIVARNTTTGNIITHNSKPMQSKMAPNTTNNSLRNSGNKGGLINQLANNVSNAANNTKNQIDTAMANAKQNQANANNSSNNYQQNQNSSNGGGLVGRVADSMKDFADKYKGAFNTEYEKLNSSKNQNSQQNSTYAKNLQNAKDLNKLPANLQQDWENYLNKRVSQNYKEAALEFFVRNGVQLNEQQMNSL